jgi:hypothetical protein
VLIGRFLASSNSPDNDIDIDIDPEELTWQCGMRDCREIHDHGTARFTSTGGTTP